MRIAQVAPLYERVPPVLYGGTERVVSHLTEELVRMGHDVTLFASGDSLTQARLIPASPRALRLDPSIEDTLAHHIVMLDLVLKHALEFDIIHFHIDHLHYPISRALHLPTVTTLHGRLDIPDLVPVYKEFPDMPLVSISDAQREPLPWVRWKATIPHGLPIDLFRFQPKTGDYLASVGRISPEKRVDRAIEIARGAQTPLRIAAKVDQANREYFESEIEPLLAQSGVKFVGEIGEDEKEDFLGRARALLFPIEWPEPFGLVMIEAMACGTPVVAFRRGSVPEVIRDGVSGFIVESVDDAVAAARKLGDIDRARCRREFESRFTARRMALDYVRVYQDVIGAGRETRLKEAVR